MTGFGTGTSGPLLAGTLALALGWVAITAVSAAPHPGVAPVTPAPKHASPPRKKLDLTLPLAAPVPAELVPNKPRSTERVPASLAAVLAVGPAAPISAVAFSPDGSRLFVGTYGRVAMWDLATGTVTGHLEGIDGAVHHLAFSPDGKLLGVGGGLPARSGTVLLYDAASPARPVKKLAGHTDVVYDFAWSPNSARIATASFDKQVRIWDAAAGATTQTIKDHSDVVYAVAFSPDGAFIVSGGKDKSVKLFKTDTGKSIRALTGHNAEVLAVAVAPDGKSILSTGVEPALRWWNPEDGSVTRNQGAHGGEVYEIRASKDGKNLTTVGSDQTVWLWDAASGSPVRAFRAGERLLCAAESPDGKRIAAGSDTGIVRLWDAASGRLLALLVESPDPAQPGYLAAVPEGYVAASDSMAKLLRWKVGGQDVPADPFTKALAKPEEVLKALKGEAVTGVKIEVSK
jgi:WD40 repeat protein